MLNIKPFSRFNMFNSPFCSTGLRLSKVYSPCDRHHKVSCNPSMWSSKASFWTIPRHALLTWQLTHQVVSYNVLVATSYGIFACGTYIQLLLCLIPVHYWLCHSVMRLPLIASGKACWSRTKLSEYCLTTEPLFVARRILAKTNLFIFNLILYTFNCHRTLLLRRDYHSIITRLKHTLDDPYVR